MANRNWVGSFNGGTWSATSNWAEGSPPVAGDFVYVSGAYTGSPSFINVNQDIENISYLKLEHTVSTGYLHLAGTTSSNSGSSWTLTAPTTIEVIHAVGTTSATLYNNSITGTGLITKTGAGALHFWGTSVPTWSGGIDIQEGTIAVETVNNKLGSGGIFLRNGAALAAFTAARSLQNPLTIYTGTAYLSALAPAGPTYSNTIAALTITGAVSLPDLSTTINVGSAGATLSGVITSANGLTKAGNGNLVLSNNNTSLVGTITVSQGTLTAGANGATGDFGAAANNIEVASTATASVNRSNAYQIDGSITGVGTFSKVTGTGTLTLTNPTISVTTMTLSAGTTEFANAGAQNVSSAIGGAGAITKSLGGTLTFSGAGSNTGAWAVNAGTLDVTAAQTGASGTITVGSGATLTTSAAIAKPLTVNGTATIGAALTGQWVVGAGGRITFTGGSSSTASPTLNGTSTNGATAIVDGGTVTNTSSLDIGGTANSYGTLWVKSGTAQATGSVSSTQQFVIGNVATGAGYIRLTGGTLSGRVSSGNAGVGVVDVEGGTASLSKLLMAGGLAAQSSVHFLSGTHTYSNSDTGFAYGAGTPTTRYGALVIDSATLTGPALYLSYTATDTAPIYLSVSNGGLFGGNISSASSLGTNAVFLNNGTIRSPTSGTLLGGGSSEIIILGGGGTLAALASVSSIVSAPIKDRSDSGVTSIPVSTPGSGYKGAPLVKITGGGGKGAVARAVVDLDPVSATYGQVTGVTVLNPGTGYTSVPTVSLQSGGAVTAATLGTPVITAFSSPVGGLVKDSPGTIALTATNTNTGTYSITDGTLSIGNAGTAGTLGNGDASAVSIASGKTLNFNRSDSRTYTGVIGGAGNITKTTSGGTAILNADNTFTGTVTATTGALRAIRAASFGAGASSLTTASGGAIELDGGITVARPVNLVGTGVGANGALRNITGNNTISETVAFTTGASIGSDAGTLTLSNTGAVTAATSAAISFVGNGDVDFSPQLVSSQVVTKSAGTGAAILRNTNTYSGVTTVTTGRLGYVGNIALSTAGNFGTSATAVVVTQGAGVRYYGTGSATFSRPIQFSGATAGTTHYLESNGTGAVSHTVAPTYATANVTKTLGLGGTGTAANTIGYVIANNGTGAVSVTKADAGKWVASQNNTATGAYAVNGGTLILQGTNTPSSVAVSNAETVLGLEIATWAANAKRTGNALVTVNANAKIQTFNGSGASAQNGRHTYSNLTFAANGRIRIGG